jgi:hypothetical protein
MILPGFSVLHEERACTTLETKLWACTTEPGQSLTEAVTYIRVIVASWISWQTGPQDLQTHARTTVLS